MKHRTLPLLIEVGCEEIPARFLEGAREDFRKALEAVLKASEMLPPSAPAAHCYATPRRLVAWVPELLEKQPEKVEEILGPPVRVAFDAQARPTRAAESFAAKNGVHLNDLVRLSSPKGEYLAVRKKTPGRLAKDLLPELLPAVILGLSFPKSLYWVTRAGPRFVRPIRWLLALLGEGKQARTIPFEIAGVKAGDWTRGHRVAGKGSVRVLGFEDYAKKLRAMGVEFDPEKRRERVRAECKALLEKSGLSIIADKVLEDWIVNSCEWPRALFGRFDERYLRLPREILVTVMRDHQKYFAVEDRQGRLQPHFLAVLNQDDESRGLIRRGHERVLAARFTDAEFFWEADQRVRLEGREARLEDVTYEAELGSYAAKVRRMTALVARIVEKLEPQGRISGTEKGWALRAARLSKCDLTTQMVQEFPELQGVVGGLYASVQGEPLAVTEAIYDHYLPQGLEDRVPRSVVGGAVSLADKLDSLAGGFALGHEPTGSSDPFALRRSGNAIIKVVVELSLPLVLSDLLQEAVNALDVAWRRPREEVFAALREFMAERLRYYLETVPGFRYDTVRAVMAAGWDVAVDALWRARALERIRGTENFEALSLAARRIKNILAKSATAADWEPGDVDESWVREKPEEELYRAYRRVAEEAGGQAKAGKYEQALEAIARLRPAVDKFFDHVLVMAEDRALRQNRLRLLGKLDELFTMIAHFAEIAAGPAHVDASTSPPVKQV